MTIKMIETITVGRLLCGSVRDCLEQAKFRGFKIEWIESGGLIERDFTIKGDPTDVMRIITVLNETFGEKAT